LSCGKRSVIVEKEEKEKKTEGRETENVDLAIREV
jgi:hypothetical protein